MFKFLDQAVFQTEEETMLLEQLATNVRPIDLRKRQIDNSPKFTNNRSFWDVNINFELIKPKSKDRKTR